jgi:hypothetical protein
VIVQLGDQFGIEVPPGDRVDRRLPPRAQLRDELVVSLHALLEELDGVHDDLRRLGNAVRLVDLAVDPRLDTGDRAFDVPFRGLAIVG